MLSYRGWRVGGMYVSEALVISERDGLQLAQAFFQESELSGFDVYPDGLYFLLFRGGF